jgi:hypothetical protein
MHLFKSNNLKIGSIIQFDLILENMINKLTLEKQILILKSSEFIKQLNNSQLNTVTLLNHYKIKIKNGTKYVLLPNVKFNFKRTNIINIQNINKQIIVTIKTKLVKNNTTTTSFKHMTEYKNLPIINYDNEKIVNLLNSMWSSRLIGVAYGTNKNDVFDFIEYKNATVIHY